MSDTFPCMKKISLRNQDNYLVISIKEPLADSEFLELKNVVLQNASLDSVDGVVIDLKALTVIDSFTTRILNNVALLADKKNVPIILSGIKPIVTEVMKRQGLGFSADLVNQNTDVSKSLSQLDELQVNYR